MEEFERDCPKLALLPLVSEDVDGFILYPHSLFQFNIEHSLSCQICDEANIVIVFCLLLKCACWIIICRFIFYYGCSVSCDLVEFSISMTLLLTKLATILAVRVYCNCWAICCVFSFLNFTGLNVRT